MNWDWNLPEEANMKPNMANIMKQAQKMQEEMQKAQKSLENITVEATSGGGMVKVEANCNMQILSIKIEPEVFKDNDQEMLEDLVVAAVNQALTNAQQKSNEEMQKVTGGMMGGLNLPGGLKFPGM
jgi:nucleoid-associated protein EbfC